MVNHTDWQSFDLVEIVFGQEVVTYIPVDFNLAKLTLKRDEKISSLNDGSIVDLKIKSSRNNFSLTTKCLVNHEEDDRSVFIFLATFEVQGIGKVPERETVPLIPFDMPLIGSSHQPWFIGSKFKFKVVSLFKNGLTIFYDPFPNITLIPGVELELHFPNERTGFSRLMCKVLSTETREGKSESRLQIKKKNSLKELRSFYHQILAFHKNVTLKTLINLEAPLPLFRGNVRITPAVKEEHFKECLALRQLAYSRKHNSKLSEGMELEKFTDQFDKGAVVFKFSYFHQIIGTARLITRFEGSEIRTMCRIPDFITNKGFIEVSRLATHIDYRGRDLFLLVLQVCLKYAFLLRRKYILFDCEDHLLPVYKKLGAVQIEGEEIIHPLENIRLNLVYIDVKKAIKGTSLSFATYFLGLIPLHHHLLVTGNMKAGFFTKIKVSLLFKTGQLILNSRWGERLLRSK